MPIFNKLTFSNILIVISIIFTIFSNIVPWFISEWSINNYYLLQGNYIHWFIQFFTGTFLHGSVTHLLFNWIFIYYFGNILEIIIWRNKLIIFFILTAVFNWIILSYLDSTSSTVWISWFAMAILAYYTLQLKSVNNIEYKWWITAIVINVWIWFYPWISLYWHLFWVIFWIIFFYLTNEFTKKQLIWLFRYFNKTKSTEGFNPLSIIKKD